MENDIYKNLISDGVCDRCFDSGLWLSPKSEVLICPKVQMKQPHAEPNKASLILLKTANRMFANKKFIHAHEFEIARVLTHFSTEMPCERTKLFDLLFYDTNLDFKGKLRKLHGLIENLRKVWLLPVGSRKDDPSGYWLITELADYKEWVERAKSAPITQLTTIHRNAKFNFPEFAEQLEFEFWNDMEPEEITSIDNKF